MYKIVFFTKGDQQQASSRIRAYLITDYMRTLGLDAQTYHVQTRAWWDISRERFSEFWRNLRLVASLDPGDVLYAQRTVYQIDFMVIVLLHKWFFGGKYIFDFDDAIFLEKGHVRQKTNCMIRNASLVIVPNFFLKDYALQYNKDVSILSSCIDTEHLYKLIPRPENERIKIGWTGSPSHYDNLKLVIAPLERLAAEGYPIEFMQIGGGERIHQLLASVKGLAVTFVTNLAWGDPAATATYVRQFDIGITPLEKTEFNRGKDPGKTKEYMACAVAVIASDWGENRRVIENGVNGLLADTEEEWYQALKRLIVDEEYRQQIAQEGREYIERTCSYQVVIPQLLILLDGVRADSSRG